MDELATSWGALTPGRAREYLKTYGAPSKGSKELLVDLLPGLAPGGAPSVLDLGCGNAQLLEFLRERGFRGFYTGVDVSEPLLAVAREVFAHDEGAAFVRADVNTLEGVTGRWDVALYSHVLEILASPEASLIAAARLADTIVVRFFEPPEFEVDTVELRTMEIGDGTTVPYLRRRMGRDYYRLVLAKLGCRKVDVYRDETAKDQVHVLRLL